MFHGVFAANSGCDTMCYSYASTRPPHARVIRPPGYGLRRGPSPRQEICEQILGCACAMPTYPDVEKCVADADSTAQVLEGLAEQYGLIFDAACFDRRLEQFGSALECHTPSELPDWDAEGCSFCAPVHGDAPIGAPCSNFRPDFYASDCAPDLGCFTTGGPGVCVPLCKVFAAGETCGLGTGQPILLPCEGGHRCDWESRRCEPLRAAGAPCSGLTGGCASDYCGPSGVCEEPGAGGRLVPSSPAPSRWSVTPQNACLCPPPESGATTGPALRMRTATPRMYARRRNRCSATSTSGLSMDNRELTVHYTGTDSIDRSYHPMAGLRRRHRSPLTSVDIDAGAGLPGTALSRRGSA